VSDDGIHFERPEVNEYAWRGDRQNNIIFDVEPFTHTVAPFIDTRPGVPATQRYKALSRNLLAPDSQGKRGAFLHGMVSADGFNWDLLGNEPLITDGKFDSQNVGFWSEAEEQYIAYYRTFSAYEGMEEGDTSAADQASDQ
jgi:hypothetical protein